MASGGGSSGGMDIRQSRETWANFTRMTLWACVGIAVLLILMAMFLV
jgi:hypothetical protein